MWVARLTRNGQELRLRKRPKCNNTPRRPSLPAERMNYEQQTASVVPPTARTRLTATLRPTLADVYPLDRSYRRPPINMHSIADQSTPSNKSTRTQSINCGRTYQVIHLAVVLAGPLLVPYVGSRMLNPRRCLRREAGRPRIARHRRASWTQPLASRTWSSPSSS